MPDNYHLAPPLGWLISKAFLIWFIFSRLI
jgi:hypothetical protein